MKKTITAFLTDQRGSTTVEFCLWIPLFMFFLAATIDASVLYLTQTEMWNIARDTARRVATGQLVDNAAVYNHIAAEMPVPNNEYFQRVEADPDTDTVCVRIGMLIGEASVFGIFGMFAGHADIMLRSIEATVTMRLPPDLDFGTPSAGADCSTT